MVIISEFSLPAEEFALSETLRRLPKMRFKIDNIVANSTDYIIPFVWASNGDLTALTRTLEKDPSVKNVKVLAESEEKHLYQMNWTNKAQIIEYMLLKENATIQRATAYDERWELQVLFPNRKAISKTSQCAKENGYSLNISRINDIDKEQRMRFNLTEEQRNTLIMALEHGYFGIPREVKQSTLADELNISRQAVSERIRRGTKGILKAVLPTVSEEDTDHLR
ncbi:DNA-binding protein [halophilic archaeon]|nr:DNA-binding protein [halophilic archaeon]